MMQRGNPNPSFDRNRSKGEKRKYDDFEEIEYTAELTIAMARAMKRARSGPGPRDRNFGRDQKRAPKNRSEAKLHDCVLLTCKNGSAFNEARVKDLMAWVQDPKWDFWMSPDNRNVFLAFPDPQAAGAAARAITGSHTDVARKFVELPAELVALRQRAMGPAQQTFAAAGPAAMETKQDAPAFTPHSAHPLSAEMLALMPIAVPAPQGQAKWEARAELVGLSSSVNVPETAVAVLRAMDDTKAYCVHHNEKEPNRALVFMKNTPTIRNCLKLLLQKQDIIKINNLTKLFEHLKIQDARELV